MSTAHGHSADGHHAHGGPDHVPHVTPLPVYLKTFGALLMLTGVTVGVSYVNLGSTVNLIIALIIATIKAVTVAALFMHLYADHKFHSVVFASSVVFLLVFVSFTMFDTEYRHRFGSVDGERINMNPAPSASAEAPAAPSATPAASGASSAKPAMSAAPPPTVSAAPVDSAPPATSASAAPSASAVTSSSAAAPASAAPSAKPAASAAPAVPAGPAPTPHH